MPNPIEEDDIKKRRLQQYKDVEAYFDALDKLDQTKQSSTNGTINEPAGKLMGKTVRKANAESTTPALNVFKRSLTNENSS